MAREMTQAEEEFNDWVASCPINLHHTMIDTLWEVYDESCIDDGPFDDHPSVYRGCRH